MKQLWLGADVSSLQWAPASQLNVYIIMQIHYTEAGNNYHIAGHWPISSQKAYVDKQNSLLTGPNQTCVRVQQQQGSC